MNTAADIMATNIFKCVDTDSLLDCHNLMQENNIRHVPIVSHEDGHYVGMLTHKEVLKQAFQISSNFGTKELERHEAKIVVRDIMVNDIEPVASDLPLSEAGEFFLTRKQGCLPVCENDQVVGIITSVDFVKLSLQLLRQS